MNRAVLVFVAFLLAACGDRAGKLSLTEPSQFDPTKTYAVVTLQRPAPGPGIVLYCMLRADGTYTFSPNLPQSCPDSPAGFSVGDGTNAFGNVVGFTKLADGTLVQMLVANLSLVRDRPVVEGDYVLALQQPQNVRERRTFTRRAPVYRIRPGHVIYLGHSENGNWPIWRDPKNLGEELAEVFPKFDKDKFISDTPKLVEILDCDKPWYWTCKTGEGQS